MTSDLKRGRRIDALIHQSGITPQALAGLWECSESRISSIRGGANFSLPLLMKICSTMQWSADYILLDQSPTEGNTTITPADRYDLHLLQQVKPNQREIVRQLLASMG